MQATSEQLRRVGIAHQVVGDPTLFDVYFTDRDCVDYRSARHDDPARNVAWNTGLRAGGVFKSPGKLYPSLAVSADDLAQTRTAMEAAAALI